MQWSSFIFSPWTQWQYIFLLFLFPYIMVWEPESQLQLQQVARSIFVPSKFASQHFPAFQMNVPHEKGLGE